MVMGVLPYGNGSTPLWYTGVLPCHIQEYFLMVYMFVSGFLGLSVCHSVTAKVPNIWLTKRKGKRPCQFSVGSRD